MIEHLRPPADRVKVEVSATPIQPGTLSPPRATARPGGSCPHPYSNPERNSRLPGPAGAGPRTERWSRPLNDRFAPAFVTQDGDRVLVQGEGLWQLFDLAGKAVAEGRYGTGQVIMDAAHGYFCGFDVNGYVSAWRLLDGKPAYVFPPAYGESYEKAYLARAGEYYIIAEAQAEPPPGSRARATNSALEAQVVAEPPRVGDGSLRLLSGRDLGRLLLPSARIAVASHGSVVVAAVPGTIFRAGVDLKVQAALTGDFEPRQLSLDEAGRAYLLAASALWAVTPEGRRFMGFDLSAAFQPAAPPIVGYNHRVYLAARNRLLAAEPGGWSVDLPLSGAAVASDDLLVAASGNALLAFNAKGEKTVLFNAPEPLLTPPAMSAAGDLLVASGRRLFCLGR